MRMPPFFALVSVLTCAAFFCTAAPDTKAATVADFTGADLYALCASPSDLDYGYCAGYVSAVAQTLLTQSIGPSRACNHTHVRSQQLIDTYTAWAELFRDQLQQPAQHAAATAFARAFPCH